MAEAVAAGVAGERAPLDEVMLAMDVVDTLRHADRLVERELASDERDRQLKERLREIYRSQGIAVSDRVLDEGVTALKEERFVYHAPAPGWARTLAVLWVHRHRWGRRLLIGLAVFALLAGVYRFGWQLPEEQRRRQVAQELIDLPKTLAGELARIQALARDPDAVPMAERLVREGTAAAEASDHAGARAKAAELRSLRESLEQTYTLRIVSRPDQPSGVYRIPAANPRAKNYYLIVEAVAPDGRVLSFPVVSEETGKTERVSRWGLRVDESVYARVRADKLDDGIIQNNRLAEKRKGYLTPDYAYPVQGGTILEW